MSSLGLQITGIPFCFSVFACTATVATSQFGQNTNFSALDALNSIKKTDLYVFGIPEMDSIRVSILYVLYFHYTDRPAVGLSRHRH